MRPTSRPTGLLPPRRGRVRTNRSAESRLSQTILPLVTLVVGALLGLGSAILTNQQSISASSEQAAAEFLRDERRELYGQIIADSARAWDLHEDYAVAFENMGDSAEWDDFVQYYPAVYEAMWNLRVDQNTARIIGSLDSSDAAEELWLAHSKVVLWLDEKRNDAINGRSTSEEWEQVYIEWKGYGDMLEAAEQQMVESAAKDLNGG